MSNNGHLPQQAQPIDRLWQVMTRWGVTRTFEDNLQVIDVMLKKDELDRVVRQCYGVEVKKGG